MTSRTTFPIKPNGAGTDGDALHAPLLVSDSAGHSASGVGSRFLVHPLAGGAAIFLASLLLCMFAASVFDVPVAIGVRSLPPGLIAVAADVTVLGLSGYMLVISGVIVAAALVLRGRVRDVVGREALSCIGLRAGFVFGAVAISGILAQVLKHMVGRARPKLLETLGAFHFDVFSLKASLASFPSGHATSVFALALSVGLILPRWRVPLFVAAILIAATRVIIDAHYTSDVIAGAGLGLATASALAGLMAQRSIVFDLNGSRLVLRGRGSIWAVLNGARTVWGGQRDG